MTDTFNNSIAHPLVEEVISDDVEAASVGLVADERGIATVNLTGPMDPSTVAALSECFETLHGSDGVRLTVLRLQDAGPAPDEPDWNDDDREDASRAIERLLAKLRELPMASLAVVEGRCQGAALELARACDVVLAAAGAPGEGLGQATPADEVEASVQRLSKLALQTGGDKAQIARALGGGLDGTAERSTPSD